MDNSGLSGVFEVLLWAINLKALQPPSLQRDIFGEKEAKLWGFLF